MGMKFKIIEVFKDGKWTQSKFEDLNEGRLI